MVNKVNPLAFFLVPMLGKGHTDNWPRFRDCFSTARHFEEMNGMPVMVPIDPKETPTKIYVLLRVGGGNREFYADEIKQLRQHPNYIVDEDDEYDTTYATFVFSVPDRWKNDYERVIIGDFVSTSLEYKELIKDVFPKLNDIFNQLFKQTKQDEDIK